MAIFTPFKTQMLTALTNANGIKITNSDLTYGSPIDISGTALADLSKKNSAVVIDASISKSWSGRRRLTYNRYDLALLKRNLGYTIRLGRTSPEEVYIEFNLRYGTQFEQDDVLVTLNWDIGTMTLKANPYSLTWIGEVSFGLIEAPLLTTGLDASVLDGLMYPNGAAGKTKPVGMFGEAYLYNVDFTSQAKRLINLKPGMMYQNSVLLATIPLVLNDVVVGANWDATADAKWGLLDAVVEYNGPAKEEYPIAGNLTHVLKLTPPKTNTQLLGSLYITYNGSGE